MTQSFTGRDLAAARERLGLSVEQLAAELGLTPHVVSGMESGGVGIPPKYATELSWRLGVMEREQALAGSGLPTCGWVHRWQRAEASAGARGRIQRLQALQAHTAACPTCAARQQFVETNFGPLPERPLPAWARMVMWVQGHVGKLPPLLRPVTYGALFMGIGSLLRIVLAANQLRSADAWIAAVEGLGISIAIGAVAGLAFGLARARRS